MTEGGKLPVWKTVSIAWRLPVVHWRALIRIVWLPLLLLFALDLAIDQATRSTPKLIVSSEEWQPVDPSVETPEGHARRINPDGNEFIAELPEEVAGQRDNEPGPTVQLMLIPELLRLALIVPVMVAWHLVLWPSSETGRGGGVMPLKLGMREFRYLGLGALLFLATIVFSLWTYPLFVSVLKFSSTWKSGFWVILGQFLWLAIVSYPALRLSPVLVLWARGDARSLDEIWRMTRGNGWRLVIVMALSGLPLAYLATISRFNTGFFGFDTSLLFEFGSVVLLLALGIVTASCLSVAAHVLLNEVAEETASDQASTKLPVWQTITDAYAFLFENRGYALRFGWIAVAATFVLGLLIGLLPDWGLAGEALVGFVELAALVPIIAVVVVPWHRMILLRETPDGIGFGDREKQYILLALQLYAVYWVFIWITYAPAIAVDSLGSSGSVLTLTFLLYMVSGFVALVVFCLFSPVLPAVAVGRYNGLKNAFELSRENRFGFVFVNFAVIMPSVILVWFLPDALFEGNWAYVGNLIYSIVYVFNGFIAATSLSLCYHRMGGMQGEAGTEPPTASP